VTPQAFALAHGHIWLIAARDSVKVRALQRRPRIGLLFREGSDSLAVAGTAEVLSPWAAADALRLASLGPLLSCAAGDFATRNARLIAGYAADIGRRRATLPVDRVLIRVAPGKTWRLGDEGGDRLSIEVADDALAGDGTPVLGLATPDGPVVLPAVLDGLGVSVSAAALRAVGASLPAAACVSVDRSTGGRPSRFAGLLLRGELVERAPGKGVLVVERTTAWKGFEAHTTQAA
jgi:hypothetical protein